MITQRSLTAAVEQHTFDSKEEAEAFAEKYKAGGKNRVASEPYEQMRTAGYSQYEIVYRHDSPTKGTGVYMPTGKVYGSLEEARAAIDGEHDELNDIVNAKLAEGKKKGEGKKKDYVKIVSYTEDGRTWKYGVVLADKYAPKMTARDSMPFYLGDGFGTLKEAQAFVDEHREEWDAKIADIEKARRNFAYFNGTGERTGQDWRKGADVSAEQLMEQFGFRGVQFGNWTNQRDRQAAVNGAFDALMDLAQILGVSPRALSLNGELGLAFGSRGGGSAKAHYEPGEVVINLTKTQGAGSLAHEWWHALDNYFARHGNVKGGMVTESKGIAMRDELREAFNALIDSVAGSGYDARSRQRGASYWGRPAEETARLFAAWVNDELQKRGLSSPFLSDTDPGAAERYAEMMYRLYKAMYESRKAETGGKAMTFEEFKKTPLALSGFVFPGTEELAAFGGHLRNIFNTVQEKVDEETGKTLLYHRGPVVAEPNEAEQALLEVVNEAVKGSGIEVVTDVDEVQKVLDAANGKDVRTEARHRSEESEERNKMWRLIDRATAMFTGKTEKEAREARRKEMQKITAERKEMYDRVLSGNFDEVTLRQIDNYIDNFSPYNNEWRPISKRLPQKALRGLRKGERASAVDVLFSRISESAVPKNERAGAEGKRRIEEKKKELLKKWAIATGNWHTSVSDFDVDETPIGKGKDSVVYQSKDGKHVIKVSKGKDGLKKFRPDIDAVTLFNYIFPESRYEILGYGEVDGKFVKFLKQPVVDFTGSKPLSAEERVAYMADMGFKPVNKEKTAFSNGSIVVADLQGNNIVRDKSGNIRVIDADVKLHTRDFGGQYSYPPVEADTALPQANNGGKEVPRFFRTPGGEAFGFTVGGKIYVDPRIATADTPIHEYAHLWGDMMRRVNPKAWGDIVRLMKDKGGLWDWVKEKYPELETDDQIADEVLAQFSGKRGAERLREEMRKAAEGSGGITKKAAAISALQRVKEAIGRFWRGVAELLHIRFTTAEEVADRVMADLLHGVDPRKVMDGGKSLRPETRISIVETSPEHGFKNYTEAKTWAKEHIARTYSSEETGGKGTIRISNAAVGKYLSQSAVDKSDSKDVHLAVLKVLPEVLRESVDAEQHADHLKGEDGVRSAENGINPDVTIHRLYGAVTIGGKLYRVKVTLKEDMSRSGDPKKAYSYEATKIELLAGQHGKDPETERFPRNSNNSITAANLLHGVEKSYGGGKFFEDYWKPRYSLRHPFGGNSGYVGYSMSKRAAQAREDGRYPKTDFRKEYSVTPKTFDALVDAGIIDGSEWHHTSMYGNKTHFYGWGPMYDAVYAANKKEVDKMARTLRLQMSDSEFLDFTINDNPFHDRPTSEEYQKKMRDIDRQIYSEADGINLAYDGPRSPEAERKRMQELDALWEKSNRLKDIVRSQYPEDAAIEAESVKRTDWEAEQAKKREEEKKALKQKFKDYFDMKRDELMYDELEKAGILTMGADGPHWSKPEYAEIFNHYKDAAIDTITEAMAERLKNPYDEDYANGVSEYRKDLRNVRDDRWEEGMALDAKYRDKEFRKQHPDRYERNKILEEEKERLREKYDALEEDVLKRHPEELERRQKAFEWPSYEEAQRKAREELLAERLQQFFEEDTADPDEGKRFRLLDDDDPQAQKLESLPEGELVPVYRNVQVFDDDSLGSPMAFSDAVTGERRRLEGGKWNYSEPREVKLTPEQQRQLDELNRNGYLTVNGKKTTELPISKSLKFVKPKNGDATLQYHLKKSPEDSGLWAAYNPYDHAVETPLNTQFAEAYKRPNLVVVRSLVPKSELEGHYKAPYAKDSTGAHKWNNGRTLYLSRYSKIDKVLTREEEAKLIDEYWKKNPGKREALASHRDYRRFVPEVRKALEKMGYRFELDGKELTPEEAQELDRQQVNAEPAIPGEEGRVPRVGPEDIARINAKMSGKWVGEPKETMVQSMVRRVKELAAKLGVKVRIVTSADELPKTRGSRQRRMKGMYDTRTGEVTIVIGNHENLADVENTVLHEVVGHRGFRILFKTKEAFDHAMDELYRVSSEKIRKWIDDKARKLYDEEVDRIMARKKKERRARGEDPSEHHLEDMTAAAIEASRKKDQFRREATEEYGAHLAGRIGEKGFEKLSAEEQTYWGRLKSMLQKALQRLAEGLNITGKHEWTDKDWAYVLHEAYKREKNGGKPSIFDEADTIAMRMRTGFGEGKEERKMTTLSGEEAKRVLNEIFSEKSQTAKPEKISSLARFREIFNKPIRTFLGEVIKVKDAVWGKILREKRQNISGAILPTLQNADFAIRDTDGSILYVKRFLDSTGEKTYNVAVVNKHGELEDYISSVHIKNNNNLLNKIEKGAELLIPENRNGYGHEVPSSSTPDAKIDIENESGNTFGLNKDKKSSDENPDEGMMFRDGDDDDIGDVDLGLGDAVDKMREAAVESNANNLHTKREAMKAIGGNLSKLRQAMARHCIKKVAKIAA